MKETKKGGKKMEAKKYIKTIALLVFIVLVGFALGKWISPSTAQEQETAEQQTITGDVQEVTLGLGATNYNPEMITVNVGQPVRITADLNTLTGCFRSFRIPELDVQDTFSEKNPYIEFTPTEKGTFTFTCSMGMGRGTLIVQ